MFKRAWLLFSLLWAAAFLGNNMTRTVPEIGAFDLFVAGLPLIIGAFVFYGLRFIVTGSFAKRRVVVYRGPVNRA